MQRQSLRAAILIAFSLSAACTPMPIPTFTPSRNATPRPITTPQVIIIADAPTRTSTPTIPVEMQAESIEKSLDGGIPMPLHGGHRDAAVNFSIVSATSTPPMGTETQTVDENESVTRARRTPTPTPTPISFLQQQITNLFDLSRLPVMEHSTVIQFTSRNWTSLEHYFDYFIDDGNFTGPHYGYLNDAGVRTSYRIVTGYDGAREYEIVPHTEGPGAIVRLWFAYQQHQSINNPKDMSQVPEWNNWGNLGAMGNIRFYFDDELTPSIDLGLKDLFVGQSPFPAPLAAFYASANGGNINYVPIPFEKSIRVTTTGRPRFMQIQVKRFPADSVRVNSANPLRSFTPYFSPDERTALDQATRAWQDCTPAHTQEYQPQSFSLSIPSNQSAAVDFNVPVTIESLRVRVPRGMDDSVWMQVFWDDEPQPSMSTPLRAMFSTAERLLPYHALPMGFDDSLIEHVFYTNLPMPFQSARIVFINNRAETLPLTLEVATRATTPGTENTRLHAFFGTRRMNAREDDGDNYVLVDVKGRGKYLGTIFSAWDLDRRALNGPLDPNWRFPYLESNMDVWVDDRLVLPGTGIEDDFNASYYYVFAGHSGYNTKYCLAGLTLLDYNTPKEPSSQYRFYLNDAPEFRKHLRVEVQHGNKGNNLSVTYSSTAFWYQIK